VACRYSNRPPSIPIKYIKSDEARAKSGLLAFLRVFFEAEMPERLVAL
jgi:hypothetical protein